MTPRLHLKVALNDDVLLGPGKEQLLQLVERTGSISAAARQMKMSYRRAWLLIDELNRVFKSPVVTTAKGGRGGGGSAVLTPLGIAVLKRYRAIVSKSGKAIAAEMKALAKDLR